MAREAALRPQKLERDGRFPWVHREMAADGEDGQVGLVDPADQLHVPEDARVSGEVDLLAILELEDEAGRFAQGEHTVLPHAARVARVRHGDLDAGHLDRAALVRCFAVVLGKPLRGKPVADLDHGDHRTSELLRQLDRLSEMVAVGVSERDQVDAFGLLLRLRAFRVLEPGIDVGALAAGAVKPERCMAEPG